MTTLAQHAMPRVVNRYFEVSLFLLVSVGFLALAATNSLDLVSVVIVGAALSIKVFRYRHQTEPELSARTVTVLTILYVPFYLADLFFLSVDFVLATAHMVLFVAVVRIYSARSNRDYLWLAAVAFLEILAAAVLTVDTVFLLFFLLFLVLSISTFVSFEIKHSLEKLSLRQHAPDPGGFAVRLPRTLTYTAWSVAFAVLSIAGVLFFILPRVNFGYLSAYDFRAQQLSGFSAEVTLGEIGSIKRDRRIVMRIMALEGPSSGLSGIHWRGSTLAKFDGQTWTALPGGTYWMRGSRVFLSGLGFRPLTNVPLETVRYRVLREPVSTRTLFAAATPVLIQGRFRRLQWGHDSALYLSGSALSTMNYEVTSRVATPTPEILRSVPREFKPNSLAGYVRGPVDPKWALEGYLQLPDLDPRIAQLSEEIIRPYDNLYDQTRAIEQHLRNEYGYTLDLLDVPVDDPLAHFLFERREGHCEYFASSMVIMLRTQGIPARMVNGFLTGEFNDISDNYIVRAADAHTWVEVFFPTVGWVEFDPTPPDPELASHDFWSRLSLYYDAFDLWWDEWIINYDSWQQEQMAQKSILSIREWTNNMRSWIRRTRRAASRDASQFVTEWMGDPYMIGGAIGLLILAGGVWKRRRIINWLRELRLMRNGKRSALTSYEATLLYLRLLRSLKRKGFTKPPGQTPLEFVGGLAPEDLAADVREFTNLYNLSRFSVSETGSARMVELLRNVEFRRWSRFRSHA